MAPAPSSPLYLTLHRGGAEIVTSEVASLELAIDVADTLIGQSGICTIRDRGGRLLYAVNDRGQRYSAAEGSPSDLWSWFKDKK